LWKITLENNDTEDSVINFELGFQAFQFLLNKRETFEQVLKLPVGEVLKLPLPVGEVLKLPVGEVPTAKAIYYTK
jgi:hypothetical protein